MATTDSSRLQINEIIMLNTKYEGEGIVIRKLDRLEKLVNSLKMTHGNLLFKNFLDRHLSQKYMFLKKYVKITE